MTIKTGHLYTNKSTNSTVETSINFEEDKTDVLDKSDNLKILSNEVQKMESLAKEIENIEDTLKSRKKDLDVISGEVIPTMMSEMGLSQLKLMDGSTIDVKPFYNATITQANKEAAFNWLRNNDLGDIIKNEVVIRFGRGEENRALELVKELDGRGLSPDQKRRVEPMTIKGFVREQIERGVNLPQDKFGVYTFYDTKIIKP